MARPRNPIFASTDPLAKMFIKAMVKGHLVNFIYCGGSTPGAARTASVSLVFQHEPRGRIYIAAYCPERGANRIFALDLVMVIHARN
jgi:predicted DNA-binding transcriptional regulator YafY